MTAIAASQALVRGLEIGLAVALLLALGALGGLVHLWREVVLVRRASRALGNGGLRGLDQVLREQELHLRQVDDRVTEVERRLGHSERRLAGAIQRVKVLRFNPFRDTGGDQSFVIALLDDGGSGIVLTGLHSRAETRIYAKAVSAGSSEYPLSEEEVAAIRAAGGSTVSKVAPS
jgi:hypothetical protein